LFGNQININLQWSICDIDPQAVRQKLGEDGPVSRIKRLLSLTTIPILHVCLGLMFRTKTRGGEELPAVEVHFGLRISNAPERFFGDKEAY
jgi:hypothetical protein